MGKVFGCYTDIAWQNSGLWKYGNGNTFVFSLRDDLNFIKLKCLKTQIEVYHHPKYLSKIGFAESGFYIKDNCNIKANSSSDLGYNGYFELPDGIKYGSSKGYSYLAGSHKFKVVEMEVYKLE